MLYKPHSLQVGRSGETFHLALSMWPETVRIVAIPDSMTEAVRPNETGEALSAPDENCKDFGRGSRRKGGRNKPYFWNDPCFYVVFCQ